ncbi:membrane protein insertase YidC [Paraliomyxa miuraensis]|uniref:membrane protein insertase YidC n=1 Tax=Paraliomyxa miuraensis TaxID=376150 RepID=UPI00224DFD13|nr:membrane protein insertase YidC [Paraliomyxa miuraensis]MCX4244040.1 membrane protein insertase YidC [Paraliomyxa miuraensis]
MSFQTRIFLAVALCAMIFIVFEGLNPPPPTEEVADGKAAVETKAEAEEAGTEAGRTGGGAERQPEAEESEPTPEIPVVEHSLHNDLLALQITNRSPGRGGLVSAVQMLSTQFQGHATATDSLALAGKRTLEVAITDDQGDPLVPRGAAYEVTEVTEDRITLVHRTAKLEVTQRLELLGGYEGRLEVEVSNKGGQPLPHRVHVRTRIGQSESRYDIRRGVCRTPEDVEDEDQSDLEDGPIKHGPGVVWGGVDGKYFTSLVVPKQPVQDCELALSDDGAGLETRLGTVSEEVAPGRASTHVFGLYVGPKELERLKAFSAVDSGVQLEQAIDWGFFGGVSEWLGKMLLALLRWFHDLVQNWGLSIVLLTVLIKLVTLPLTLKQMSSMKRMKEIQPEMNKIKEKYGDDRVKQGQEMQALFARSGVNPLAGCFPMLVQLPIWFALYSMLGAAVELVHEPFLWLPDLTEQDPFYILPLALGALMIVQNRMMPSTMDAAQAKLMRWVMPIMFTVFMLFLPSGLGVYIFANIVLSLVQTAIQVGTNKNAEAPAT